MRRLIALIILVVIAVAVFNSGDKTADQSGPSASATTQPEKPKPKEIIPPPAIGEEVPEAYYKQVKDDAWWDCMKAVERSAKYDLRWTKTFLGTQLPTFDRWNKYQRQDGHVVLYGDEAEAQNGIGNWVRVNYRCEFDPAAKRVVEVELNQGRLRD
jgi:hypothetical protein